MRVKESAGIPLEIFWHWSFSELWQHITLDCTPHQSCQSTAPAVEPHGQCNEDPRHPHHPETQQSSQGTHGSPIIIPVDYIV